MISETVPVLPDSSPSKKFRATRTREITRQSTGRKGCSPVQENNCPLIEPQTSIFYARRSRSLHLGTRGRRGRHGKRESSFDKQGMEVRCGHSKRLGGRSTVRSNGMWRSSTERLCGVSDSLECNSDSAGSSADQPFEHFLCACGARTKSDADRDADKQR